MRGEQVWTSYGFSVVYRRKAEVRREETARFGHIVIPSFTSECFDIFPKHIMPKPIKLAWFLLC